MRCREITPSLVKPQLWEKPRRMRETTATGCTALFLRTRLWLHNYPSRHSHVCIHNVDMSCCPQTVNSYGERSTSIGLMDGGSAVAVSSSTASWSDSGLLRVVVSGGEGVAAATSCVDSSGVTAVVELPACDGCVSNDDPLGRADGRIMGTSRPLASIIKKPALPTENCGKSSGASISGTEQNSCRHTGHCGSFFFDNH